jgi:hypothetical protein
MVFTVAAMVAVGCGAQNINTQEAESPEVSQQTRALDLPPMLYYNGNCAAAYAKANYSKIGPAPFHFYEDARGNGVNCANFGSQSIMAGFLCSTDPSYIHEHRAEFKMDAGSSKMYKWYYNTPTGGKVGDAWISTSLMRRYAIASASELYGLKFAYVTRSTATSSVDVYAVQPGDIVFVDWENDWEALEAAGQRGFNHTMIVSEIDYGKSDDSRIKLAAHTDPVEKLTLKALKTVAPSLVVHIYRPTVYIRGIYGGGGVGSW